MAVLKRTGKSKSGEIRLSWVVRYRDAEGKYRQITFKTLRDAKAWDARAKAP
jgi:hypothetical protein